MSRALSSPRLQSNSFSCLIWCKLLIKNLKPSSPIFSLPPRSRSLICFKTCPCWICHDFTNYFTRMAENGINSVAFVLYQLFFYFSIKTSLRTNTLLICGDVIFKALLIPACLGQWKSLTWCSVSTNLWPSFSIMGGVIPQLCNISSSWICGRILKRLENSASSSSLRPRQKRGTWFNKCTNKLSRVQKVHFTYFIIWRLY